MLLLWLTGGAISRTPPFLCASSCSGGPGFRADAVSILFPAQSLMTIQLDLLSSRYQTLSVS
jgi:hypothetical protein